MKSQASKADNYLYELLKGGVIPPVSLPEMAEEVIFRRRLWRAFVQNRAGHLMQTIIQTEIIH